MKWLPLLFALLIALPTSAAPPPPRIVSLTIEPGCEMYRGCVNRLRVTASGPIDPAELRVTAEGVAFEGWALDDPPTSAVIALGRQTLPCPVYRAAYGEQPPVELLTCRQLLPVVR